MSRLLNAREIIFEWVKKMGLPCNKIEDNGIFGLVFDEDTLVTLEPDPSIPNVLYMHTVVAEVPPEKRRTFLSALLRGNYLGRATRSAILSLTEDQREVLLQTRYVVVSDELSLLEDSFVTLSQTARLWRQQLATLPSRLLATNQGEPPAEDIATGFMIRV